MEGFVEQIDLEIEALVNARVAESSRSGGLTRRPGWTGRFFVSSLSSPSPSVPLPEHSATCRASPPPEVGSSLSTWPTPGGRQERVENADQVSSSASGKDRWARGGTRKFCRCVVCRTWLNGPCTAPDPRFPAWPY